MKARSKFSILTSNWHLTIWSSLMRCLRDTRPPSLRPVITREWAQLFGEGRWQHEDLALLASLHSIVGFGWLSFTSFNSFWISTLDSSVFNPNVFKGSLFCFKALKSTGISLCPEIFWPRSRVASLWLLRRDDVWSCQQTAVLEQSQKPRHCSMCLYMHYFIFLITHKTDNVFS